MANKCNIQEDESLRRSGNIPAFMIRNTKDIKNEIESLMLGELLKKS